MYRYSLYRPRSFPSPIVAVYASFSLTRFASVFSLLASKPRGPDNRLMFQRIYPGPESERYRPAARAYISPDLCQSHRGVGVKNKRNRERGREWWDGERASAGARAFKKPNTPSSVSSAERVDTTLWSSISALTPATFPSRFSLSLFLSSPFACSKTIRQTGGIVEPAMKLQLRGARSRFSRAAARRTLVEFRSRQTGGGEGAGGGVGGGRDGMAEKWIKWIYRRGECSESVLRVGIWRL